MGHLVYCRYMFPLVAHAASSDAQIAAQCIVDRLNDTILFPLIALMSGIALLVFLWGGFEYVRNADNDSARQQGQNHLLYGIVGLLVMVSAYAILNVAAGTFGLQSVLDDSENLSNSDACAAWKNLKGSTPGSTQYPATGSEQPSNTGSVQLPAYQGFD